MDFGLNERVAFVAGASSGLGRAVARELLLEGCRVAICSRDSDRIRTAADELAIEPGISAGSVLPIACDVTNEGQIERALQETVDTFGDLHLLVTNSGGPPTGQIDDFDADAWREALELNLISTINLCRHALPHLRKTVNKPGGFGRILMISSLSAKQPIESLYLSNVSRAGVQGFAKSLSEEVGSDGITVNTILPGFTRTKRLSHLSEALSERSGQTVDNIEAGWASTSAVKRVGTEAEFAAAAVFLLSQRASFITGVALSVDGGAVKSLL